MPKLPTKLWKRIVRWTAIVMGLMILWAGVLLQRKTLKPLSDSLKSFQKRGIFPQEKKYLTESGEIYSWYTPKGEKPTLLFIHGSPGDWTAWKKILLETSLAKHYQLVVIDRPPYNLSRHSGGHLRDQSLALRTLMEDLCHPCGVIGHSYGAALALQLAVDYPEQVSGILSIAGTVAAPYQRARWYNRLANTSVFETIIGPSFRASNREMLFLADDLQALEKTFQNYPGKAVFIQGGADVLVPPETANYISKLWPGALISFYPTKNHFLIWTDLDLIVQVIQKWMPFAD